MYIYNNMSDIILQSQLRNAGRFHTGQGADLLAPQPHFSPSHPISLNKRKISPVGSSAFGSESVYDVPHGYIGDCYVECTLSALSSGTYCEYPGLALIESMEVRSGSNVLQRFNYQAVVSSILGRMTDSKVDVVKNAAGGAAFNSGKCYAPLPVFWGRFTTGYDADQQMAPLNTNLTNTKLSISLKFRELSELVDSGATAGTPTITTRLVYHSYNNDGSDKMAHINDVDTFKYKACDYQTVARLDSIADSTESVVDISSFRGSIAEIIVNDRLVSNQTSNIYFNNKGGIAPSRLEIDGSTYWESVTANETLLDGLTLSEVSGATTTFGTPLYIPLANSYDVAHYSGALQSEDVNKLNLVLTHTNGSASYISVAARMNVFYVIKDGSFTRVA